MGMVIFTAHRAQRKRPLYNGLLTNYFLVRHCITRRAGRIGYASDFKTGARPHSSPRFRTVLL